MRNHRNDSTTPLLNHHPSRKHRELSHLTKGPPQRCAKGGMVDYLSAWHFVDIDKASIQKGSHTAALQGLSTISGRLRPPRVCRPNALHMVLPASPDSLALDMFDAETPHRQNICFAHSSSVVSAKASLWNKIEEQDQECFWVSGGHVIKYNVSKEGSQMIICITYNIWYMYMMKYL